MKGRSVEKETRINIVLSNKDHVAFEHIIRSFMNELARRRTDGFGAMYTRCGNSRRKTKGQMDTKGINIR